MFSQPILDLVQQFERLPGIGPKSAQRLTYYLLRRPEAEIHELIAALEAIKRDLQICTECFNITESSPCSICSDPKRLNNQLCVVEEPLDLISIERTGKHTGRYHVLNGVINPLMGIGPEEIHMVELFNRLRKLLQTQPQLELIIATNPSIEGEATAMYIKKQVQEMGSEIFENVIITRIARGLPTGGDVEYADQVTLARAMEGRVRF